MSYLEIGSGGMDDELRAVRQLERREKLLSHDIRRQEEVNRRLQQEVNRANADVRVREESFKSVKDKLGALGGLSSLKSLNQARALQVKLQSEAHRLGSVKARSAELSARHRLETAQILTLHRKKDNTLERIKLKRQLIITCRENYIFEEQAEVKGASRHTHKHVRTDRMDDRKESVSSDEQSTLEQKKGSYSELPGDLTRVHTSSGDYRPLELNVDAHQRGFSQNQGEQPQNAPDQPAGKPTREEYRPLEDFISSITDFESWQNSFQSGLRLNYVGNSGRKIEIEVLANTLGVLRIRLQPEYQVDARRLNIEKSEILKKLAESGIAVSQVVIGSV